MGCGASAGTSEEKDGVNTAGTGTSDDVAIIDTPSAATSEEKGTVNTSGTGAEIAVDNTPTAAVNSKPQSQREYLFKIIVIGDPDVGKSSLLLQFTDGTFTERYMSTIGIAFKTEYVQLDGDEVELQLWDEGDEEAYGLFGRAKGIIVVYDVTNKESFNNLKEWFADVKRCTYKDVGRVLVGNKTDLEAERVIDYNTGKEYADELGIPFLETSAKDFINVNEAFIKLATVVKNIEDSRADKRAQQMK